MFQLAPQAIPADFKWSAKYYHLTYSGFISKDAILSKATQLTNTVLDGWSICHEDSQPDDATWSHHYHHTHVALMFRARLGVNGPRKMDIFIEGEDGEDDTVVHPNIQPSVGLNQMEQIMTKYHQGRKWDVTQGKYIWP